MRCIFAKSDFRAVKIEACEAVPKSRNWNEKKALYEKHGIVGGENLIVSKDSLCGAIDSFEIKRLIDTYLM